MRLLTATLLILTASSMTTASGSMVCHKNYYGNPGVSGRRSQHRIRGFGLM
jgi:hypothetical protein